MNAGFISTACTSWPKSRRGKVILPRPDPISITQYSQWFNRNLRISTSCALKAGDKETVLQMMADGKFNASLLWDKEITVDQAPDEYEELEQNLARRVKTVVKWI